VENSHNNTQRNDDDDEGAAGGRAKLIPEWSVAADDQVLLAGLAVVIAMFGLLGWNMIGGDEELPLASPTTTEDVAAPTTTVAAIAPAVTQPPTTEAPATTEAPTTTAAPAPAEIDVQAAVDPNPGDVVPGDITGTNEGDLAILTGYVANDTEKQEAEDKALAIDGIDSVQNDLIILEPDVETALGEAGVVAPTASGVGTVISVSGTIPSEDDRAGILAAAGAVPGVTQVIDDTLVVSVAEDLNNLPQVQFETSSAVIKAESFGDLDEAVTLLNSAPDAVIEVQGYTDINGSEESNLQLSIDRANAVLTYMNDNGLENTNVTAQGFGETEQWGPELADNRLVRFQEN